MALVRHADLVRRGSMLALLLGLSVGLAACGSTWEGAKEDTKENVEAVGEGVETGGEKIQKTVD
jgi:predicted small secreted protein